jgi:FkbM family methyltransferase
VDVTEGVAAVNRALDARDYQAARERIGVLLTEHPAAPDALWVTGRFLGLLKSYAQAAVQYKLAVKGDPSLSHVEFDVGGKVVRLRDVPGSTWAADVLDEFARGMYRIGELRFRKGDIVVDVGAHIGGVSVILATLQPKIRIIAYEPSSSNFAMLTENLRANRITNVTAVREAVTGEPGEMTLTWSATATAGSIVGLPDESRRKREAAGWSSETVRCVTLDQVFEQHGIDRCAWLKLDCEGAEWDIMAKANVLERIDRISLELHLPGSRQATGLDALVREFSSLVNRVPKPPVVEVSSTVWTVDA